eukprot:Lithocolla_globosa_v1_NODE_3521_length_1650_cov_5.903448.p2 type:complete len:126 gc:universal NODE_3521_length_1650_cov_5.903448:1102-1479(+)
MTTPLLHIYIACSLSWPSKHTCSTMFVAWKALILRHISLPSLHLEQLRPALIMKILKSRYPNLRPLPLHFIPQGPGLSPAPTNLQFHHQNGESHLLILVEIIYLPQPIQVLHLHFHILKRRARQA